VLYRPSCAECSACLSARIRVADFEPSRSRSRRVLQAQPPPASRVRPRPWATEEQFALFRAVSGPAATPTGGMADMDLFEFAAMVEETPIRSRV
jgi:leucyl-tRNA---protein transferase